MPSNRLLTPHAASHLVEPRVHRSDVHDVAVEGQRWQQNAIPDSEGALHADQGPCRHPAYRRLQRPPQKEAGKSGDHGADGREAPQ